MSLSVITKKAMKVIAAEKASSSVVDPVPTVYSSIVINAVSLRATASAASAAAGEVRRAWQRASYAERASRTRLVREKSHEAQEWWKVKDAACKESYKQWDAARSLWRRAHQIADEAESAALKSEIERLRSRTETEVLKDEVSLLRDQVDRLKVALSKE